MKTLRMVLLALIVLVAGMVTSADAQRLLIGLNSPNPQVSSDFADALATGDVNGDGKADIVVGADSEDVGGNTNQGQAYVFSGDDGSLLYTLDTPVPQEYAYFGWSVAVGDVDGDEKADIAVGAPYQELVHVFSGADGDELFTLESLNPQADALFGWSLAMGDVNNDGKADIAVGAAWEDVGGNADQGRAYVFSGPEGVWLFTLDTPNPQADASFGSSLAMGELNGDGKADIAVGAAWEDVGGNADQGRAYVFSGDDGSWLFTLDSPNPGAGAIFGDSLAMGDVNGDGKADMAVGAPLETVGANDWQGRAYVFSGDDGSRLFTLDMPNPLPTARFGHSVAVGDVNDDSKGDIAVGARTEDVGGNDWQGRAYVFSGADGDLLCTLDSPNPQATGEFGESLAMDDVNANGGADIAVGAPREDVGSNADQGQAYVFSAGELPPGGTDRYSVTFTAGSLVIDAEEKCPSGCTFTGVATVVRGDPYWEVGKQCVDYHIQSLTVTGTVAGEPVEINVGEDLIVPVSSGAICDGHATLDVYFEQQFEGVGSGSGGFTVAQDDNHLCSCCTTYPECPPEEAERWSSIDCQAEVSEVPPNEVIYNCGPEYPICDCGTDDERGTVGSPDTGGALLFAPVGGVAEWPGATADSDQSAESSSGSGFNYTALGGALAAATAALAAVAWLARRRWAR